MKSRVLDDFRLVNPVVIGVHHLHDVAGWNVGIMMDVQLVVNRQVHPVRGGATIAPDV